MKEKYADCLPVLLLFPAVWLNVYVMYLNLSRCLNKCTCSVLVAVCLSCYLYGCLVICLAVWLKHLFYFLLLSGSLVKFLAVCLNVWMPG